MKKGTRNGHFWDTKKKHLHIAMLTFCNLLRNFYIRAFLHPDQYKLRNLVTDGNVEIFHYQRCNYVLIKYP